MVIDGRPGASLTLSWSSGTSKDSPAVSKEDARVSYLMRALGVTQVIK